MELRLWQAVRGRAWLVGLLEFGAPTLQQASIGNRKPSTRTVKDVTRHVKTSAPGVKDETPGVKGETPTVKDETPGVKDETPTVKDVTTGVKDQTPGVKDVTWGVKTLTWVTKVVTWSVKTFTLTVKDATRNGGVSTRIAKNLSISAKTTQNSLRAASKVRIFPTDYDKFSVMPRRGNGLQPRVAASATLGKEKLVLNRHAVASAWCIFLGESDATA
jgi:hypothetical protein